MKLRLWGGEYSLVVGGGNIFVVRSALLSGTPLFCTACNSSVLTAQKTVRFHPIGRPVTVARIWYTLRGSYRTREQVYSVCLLVGGVMRSAEVVQVLTAGGGGG